jgi:hypothetical protein
MAAPRKLVSYLVHMNIIFVMVFAICPVIGCPIDMYMEWGTSRFWRLDVRLWQVSATLCGLLVLPVAYRSVLRGSIRCSKIMTWLYWLAAIPLAVYAVIVAAYLVLDAVEVLKALADRGGRRIMFARLMWLAAAAYMPVAALLQSRWTRYLNSRENGPTQ